ncbi:MAG: hypothetical protein M1817_006134 [Caeruleum heppii]|nr:MAG: hypothetical protein M1817_006134 [Caeruleum heppii]
MPHASPSPSPCTSTPPSQTPPLSHRASLTVAAQLPTTRADLECEVNRALIAKLYDLNVEKRRAADERKVLVERVQRLEGVIAQLCAKVSLSPPVETGSETSVPTIGNTTTTSSGSTSAAAGSLRVHAPLRTTSLGTSPGAFSLPTPTSTSGPTGAFMNNPFPPSYSPPSSPPQSAEADADGAGAQNGTISPNDDDHHRRESSTSAASSQEVKSLCYIYDADSGDRKPLWQGELPEGKLPIASGC